MFTNKTLWKRLGFTVMVLTLYQIAITTPLPNLSAKVADSPLLSLLNITSGGGFKSLTLFALGLAPYITATIIVQLLSSGVSKSMTLWSEQGTVGRKKLDIVTKVIMITLALIQAPSLIYAFKQLGTLGITQTPTLKTYVFATLIVTAGASASKFLGDELNRNGLGNGASLLIASNIAAGLPETLKAFVTLITGKGTQAKGWIAVSIFVIGFLLIIFMELTEKRIKLQVMRQTKRSSKNAYLPVKLNPSGMVPVIFAGGLIAIAQSLTTIAGSNSTFKEISAFFSLTGVSGKIVYGSVVFFFGVFYAFTQLNPTKLTKQLMDSGTYIIDVPYEHTEQYLALNIVQMSIIGSALLTIMALVPYLLGIGQNVSLISLLILIIAVIEIARQINGLAHKNKYDTIL